MTTTLTTSTKKAVVLKVRYTTVSGPFVRVENYAGGKIQDSFFVTEDVCYAQCLVMLGEGWTVVD